jgi:hypothetical protein
MSAVAQIPPFPVTPTNTTVTAGCSCYPKLPALSPMQYMIFTWLPSPSPNIREYEFDLFPTPVATNAELVLITKGTNVVIDSQQYPVGFPGIIAINSQGQRSVMLR